MADDIPENLSTTAIVPIGTSVYGTIDIVGDHDWYRVELQAGKTYEFRLHGMGIDQITDTYLRLRDASGNEIAQNDDSDSWTGYNIQDSRIIFTATTSGSYFLDASTYLDVFYQPHNPSDSTTGNFLLTAVEENPAGMVFTVDEIAWQLIDNGEAFFDDPPAAFVIGADKELTVNLTGLTTEGQALAVAALQAWTDVTGISFVQTAVAAEITFYDDNSGAYADFNSTGSVITSSYVNISTNWLAEFGTGFNSYSFETYIHEIGHALGFGHAGNYNGSADYGVDNFYLNDSLAYSIMSYMQTKGDEFEGSGVNTFVDADFRYMLTPAVADIIAIQNLYGGQVQTSTRISDTTYGFNSNSGNAALDAAVGYGSDMFMCVYDDGGIDSLDFSQAAVNQVINLNDVTPSNVLGGLMNLWIARGTIIENAFGGSASDTLTGNEFANVLDGGLGNDTLIGGGGNDTLVGGGGNDIYYVDSAADTVVETAGGGTDAVRAHSHYRLDDFVENLVLTGGAALKGHGNTLANTLTGNSGGNKLYGLAGSDTISGGAGKDVITGGAGKDIIIGGFGSDRLTGGAGADRFVFGLGDTAASKAQADTIFDMQGAKGDRIDLRAIDANEGRGGNQKFDFIHTDKFSGHAGELRYEKGRSDTYIYADTDGDRKIDFILYLDDAINLKADYFML